MRVSVQAGTASTAFDDKPQKKYRIYEELFSVPLKETSERLQPEPHQLENCQVWTTADLFHYRRYDPKFWTKHVKRHRHCLDSHNDPENFPWLSSRARPAHGSQSQPSRSPSQFSARSRCERHCHLLRVGNGLQSAECDRLCVLESRFLHHERRVYRHRPLLACKRPMRYIR